MYNYVRTLLLNMDGRQSYPADYPGEELVPPDYRPVRLPPVLQSLRTLLFGSNPDRAYLNYRLRQLLTLLHSNTLLAPYLTAVDQRLTYTVEARRRRELFTDMARGSSTQLAGPPAAFYFQGEVDADDAQGRLYHRWRVTLGNPGAVFVTRETEPGDTVTLGYTIVNGLSSPVSLTGSALACQFEPTAGCIWDVTAWARPGINLAAVLRHCDFYLNTDNQFQLFGTDSTEPYATFRGLWLHHDELAYRLGAMVLALAYRTAACIAAPQ